jgi:SNF2 family DNA or RNA helicase
MLTISLDRASQLVRIQATDAEGEWPQVRRAIEDRTSEATITSAVSLSIPVWAFLRVRKDVGYVLQRHRVSFQADDAIQKLLGDAKDREKFFGRAGNADPMDPQDVVARLGKAGFRRNLTDYQLHNVCRLAALPSGAAFSVPGAGKTAEALACFAIKRKITPRLLVVCPKNAFAVWEEQVMLCFSIIPTVVRLVGGEQNIRTILGLSADISLITYQQLVNVVGSIGEFISAKQTMMILDESHRIKKGPEGSWASAVLRLSHLPDFKLIMSGTPMPNDVSDLVPQFDFMYPEENSDRDNVRSLITPVFVRTTKAQLGLPELRRRLIPIRMKPKQRQLYELMRSEEARRLADLNPRQKIHLRAFGRSVMRLLQMVSNPALLARSDIDFPSELHDVLADGDSPKISYACLKARELAKQGNKTIIWSTFVENVELIANRLADLGADFIHGGVEAGSEEDENTRERKIGRFHKDPKAMVLVANPAACSESISLHTVCHYALYVDRNYNAAQYLQSEDRIHRLGLQPGTITNVEILVCPDTVDDSVRLRLETKVSRMARILNDDSLNIETVETDLDADGLDEEDLQDYLRHVMGQTH